ncbi:MAG: 5-formyltetrahydrofolate cyclo-ligase [Lachnospiraceae bacterium]|nr:5-formyltetrahydrofolate cyclo-ligase [Lachnospiraceae bacterium]
MNQVLNEENLDKPLAEFIRTGLDETEDPKADIDQIRRFHKAVRNRMTEEEKDFCSVPVRRHLRRLVNSLPADLSLLCYYPIGNEVNLLPIYQEWMDHGRDLYFPVTDMKKREIRFFKADTIDSFRPGAMHIPEPDSQDIKHALAEKDQLLLSITPGLVFDQKGDRIGYGGGFYDRFFAEHPQTIRIGTAFANQIEGRIPVRDWDMPLDYLVTENRIYTF